ncbi:FAD-dependent oxidoreductase [Streptomyces sp. Je 1-4]|uniref:NAD(P)/FAD-dependent oxidoreductase n=1 Tax=Streptomyces TaxID=1883 RepID=UPI00140F3696|nr:MULTISPECIES: FAD-dependent oxidoreductase [unclassified Streptomyces]QIK06364.1 FAD-dependent oxidoreductase [Streptomyces sp. ID38640]UYB39711.1 FAD-dependent oxidoreductase [Streptomyces sp. Je 1-4]UZQ35761.1 FAD-dependent oxidoreductase [Streptomyces sp. Je 1-4] [Streptomyces sp. Je 1-4 4N24]UZQ43179.1 FAD-dependent oxidoreductase [Streptomyces sp. Je 1-4] [Streptomyces sp. Je 1-4 4N24_ara]
MIDVLVLGGGFAGLWSAAAATRLLRTQGSARSVALLTPDPDLVLRPRLYQADPARMRVPLDRVLGPAGVRRIAATATAVDTGRRRVTALTPDGSRTEVAYRSLVLATGSAVVRPELPGSALLHDIDTLPAAVRLEKHLRGLGEAPAGPGRWTAVVVGAGFTGLEIATELVGRLRAQAAPYGAADEVRVVLVERAAVAGAGLGAAARPVITRALDTLGIERRLGTMVTGLDAGSVHLADGSTVPARTAVWTAGMRASALTAQIPAPRDALGRLAVDRGLRVRGIEGLYAAGDTAAALAEDDHPVLQSCQHAIPLGKVAGHNAAAGLLGLPPVDFAPAPYRTCLDLGEAGAVATAGWNRTLREGPEGFAKELKRAINETWISPPVDDPQELLRRADHRVGTRQDAASSA